ncbi:hypothetical protein AB4Z22_14425, partial [Paenibacillus sp. TAF58]
MDNLELKCIYCGKGASEDVKLSDSDIIPDALTRKRLINKNVCMVEHNNKFSGKFESYIINNMEQLRNYLGIPSKSNKLPSFKAEYVIDNIVLNKKLTAKSELFNGNLIKGTRDGKTILFGDLKKFEEFSNFSPENAEIINLENKEILQKNDIDLKIFFSQQMLRLAAKVGYEWYCKSLNVSGVTDEFKDIINFIVEGQTDQQQDIVSILTDADIYNMLNTHIEYGSHALMIYGDPDHNIYAIFSFFGLVIYKIKLCKHDLIKPNFQKLKFFGIRYDGSEVEIEALLNVSFKLISDDPILAINQMKKLILESYQTIFNTQIFTIKNFKITVLEIETI